MSLRSPSSHFDSLLLLGLSFHLDPPSPPCNIPYDTFPLALPPLALLSHPSNDLITSHVSGSFPFFSPAVVQALPRPPPLLTLNTSQLPEEDGSWL